MNISEAIQGKYYINPDTVALAGDGGTFGFELIDAENERHLLFIDRRFDTLTKDHLFANHHPDDPRALDLGIHPDITKIVESGK